MFVCRRVGVGVEACSHDVDLVFTTICYRWLGDALAGGRGWKHEVSDSGKIDQKRNMSKCEG